MKSRLWYIRHGETHVTHGRSHDPIYKIWDAMLQRCKNPNSQAYCYYGGRGIKVCEAWKDFRVFFTDMGSRPDGKTLDRINNNGNYEPSNCKWSTRKEQQNNTRRQRWFVATSPVGEEFQSDNQKKFARQHKLISAGISGCLRGINKQHKGWVFKWKT